MHDLKYDKNNNAKTILKRFCIFCNLYVKFFVAAAAIVIKTKRNKKVCFSKVVYTYYHHKVLIIVVMAMWVGTILKT